MTITIPPPFELATLALTVTGASGRAYRLDAHQDEIARWVGFLFITHEVLGPSATINGLLDTAAERISAIDPAYAATTLALRAARTPAPA